MFCESSLLIGQMTQGGGVGVLAVSLAKVWPILLVLAGFSVVILFHELGHFVVAKLCGVRVDKLAIGFGKELVGITRGGTRYSFNILPLGGYVKMLGQEDFALDKSGEWQSSSDPTSFSAQSVSKRAVIISAGVVMNLVFAAIAFMIVFMVGMEALPAKVGYVLPDSPADRSGLQTGDAIQRINGSWMDDFTDVMMAIALSDRDATLTFEVEREGQPVTLRIPPEYNQENKLLQVGITPGLTRRVAAVVGQGAGPIAEDRLQVGDTLLAVDGQEVETYVDLMLRMKAAGGREVEILVDRPLDPLDADSPTEQVICRTRATMSLLRRDANDPDSASLLGMVPRCVVTVVKEGSPAEEAEFEAGDVIVSWAALESPTISEIRASIAASTGQELKVVVLRRGERQELMVAPRRPLSLLGRGEPMVGLNFEGQDTDHLVVAEAIPGWPVRDELAIPRGARIVSAGEQTVDDWSELVEVLRERVGQNVKLTWEYGGARSEGTMFVPNCLTAMLDLPRTAQIQSIDGKKEIAVDIAGKQKLLLLPYPLAAQELCAAALAGRDEAEIEVVWLDRLTNTRSTRSVTITPASIDPWLQRVQYTPERVQPEWETVLVRVKNPLRAMWIGIKKTGAFIYQTYMTIERIIITRTVGIEKISGPVGIVKMGSEIAHGGMVRLLYFLGFISATLAVINFLPFPIVDGGLMVFLIIEKIKGRPVSLKLQMVTQLIGLVLIIGAFVFITIQDIIRWGQ